MALSLTDFTKFKKIIIQCHDNPDADALASGFALQLFFKKKEWTSPSYTAERTRFPRQIYVL